MRVAVRLDGPVELRALGCMLGAALGYSATPLVVAVAGGDSPFLFNAAWRLGLLAGFGLFGLLAFHHVWTAPDVRRRLVHGMQHPAILAAVVSNYDYALFTFATLWVSVSVAVATVVFETWPLWMILMLAYAYRRSGHYRRNLGFTAAAIGVCLVGLALVVGSQSAGYSGVGGLGDTLLGVTLALAGALVGSLAAFSFRWSSELSAELVRYPSLAAVGARFGPAGRQRYLELLCLLVAYGASSAVSAALSLAVALVRGETSTLPLLAAAFLGGSLTYAPATVSWRLGNLFATNLGVNAAIYGTPLLSLLWLFLLSLVTTPWLAGVFRFEVSRPDYLALGVLCIVAANLFINFCGAGRK